MRSKAKTAPKKNRQAIHTQKQKALFIFSFLFLFLSLVLFSPSRAWSYAFFNPPRPRLGLPEVADFDMPPFSAEEAAPPAPSSAWMMEVPRGRHPLALETDGGRRVDKKGAAPLEAGPADRTRTDFASIFFFNGPDAEGAFYSRPVDAGYRLRGWRPGSGTLKSGGGPSSRTKTWKLSDTETFTGGASMACILPDGPMLGQEGRIYDFSTSGGLVSRRLAPLVLGARARGGYSTNDRNMPLEFTLDAGRPAGKFMLRGSYGLDTVYTGFDRMAPVTRHFGGSVGYKLSGGIGFNGAVTYDVPDCAGCSNQEVYNGGMQWRPSAEGSVSGRVTFVNSASAKSYEVFAGYNQRLEGASALSFTTDFSEDWFHLGHERLVLAYNWKWGKWGLAAASTTSLDQYPAPSPDILGQAVMLKAMRVFAVP